jgi:hypothetical protein
MTREITTIAVFLSARMGAAGQTPITSTVPPGTSCTTTLNGCTLHNLTTTAPTITPLGVVCGRDLLHFQIYQGQIAAAGATYCDGNGVYTQIQRPDLGTNYVEWKLDCLTAPPNWRSVHRYRPSGGIAY